MSICPRCKASPSAPVFRNGPSTEANDLFGAWWASTERPMPFRATRPVLGSGLARFTVWATEVRGVDVRDLARVMDWPHRFIAEMLGAKG